MWDSIKKRLPGITTVVIALFVLILFTLFLFDLKEMDQSKLDLYVKYGTANGTLTTVFTGLALVLLFYTLVVQRQEMKESRDVIQYQQVENSLFHMFTVLNNVIEEMQVVSQKKNKREFNGRRVFRVFYNDLDKEMRASIMYSHGLDSVNKDTSDAWRTVYEKRRVWLPHYFRTLYRIVRFIDESRLATDESENNNKKQSLAKIVRAQLSDYELVLLFYNLSSEEGKGFKELCYRYKLLKHLPRHLLIHEIHKEQFDDEMEFLFCSEGKS